MGEVISMRDRRADPADPAYARRLARLDKVQLLEEMVAFNEARSRGERGPAMAARGVALYREVLAKAQTVELRQLAREFLATLEREARGA